ncbi:MAG TPA: aquaporin [Candidatus Sulfotelmatobacter sp.]|nr:aquaporin [Candidatus Sulfotelmatobacter sp.]
MQGQLNLRACVAELLGTFLFFAIGFTAVQAVGALQAPVLVVVPFAFGFGLLAAIAAFGPVSGGHFNPAVTVAMVLDGRTTVIDGIGYIVAQVIGGIGSALLTLILFNQDAVKGVITAPGHGFTDIQALILETVLTAIFILVILASSKKLPVVAGILIPLTLVAIHFAAVPFSGASVNPARSIGPALLGGDLGSLWIYLVGPVVGAVIGWAVWVLVARDERPA